MNESTWRVRVDPSEPAVWLTITDGSTGEQATYIFDAESAANIGEALTQAAGKILVDEDVPPTWRKVEE